MTIGYRGPLNGPWNVVMKIGKMSEPFGNASGQRFRRNSRFDVSVSHYQQRIKGWDLGNIPISEESLWNKEIKKIEINLIPATWFASITPSRMAKVDVEFGFRFRCHESTELGGILFAVLGTWFLLNWQAMPRKCQRCSSPLLRLCHGAGTAPVC